ncbi:MAG: CAP domain-containing protein [Terriglobia bacterium]
MYDLVNRDRADPANTLETKGRALPLRWNEKLAAVARAHSLDMLNRGYFAHDDPQGGSVATRVEAAGMEWQWVGENIAIYRSATRAEAAFMSEPRFTKNHRANILNASFTDIGVGIVQAADGRLFITQDFYTGPSRPGAR